MCEFTLRTKFHQTYQERAEKDEANEVCVGPDRAAVRFASFVAGVAFSALDTGQHNGWKSKDEENRRIVECELV